MIRGVCIGVTFLLALGTAMAEANAAEVNNVAIATTIGLAQFPGRLAKDLNLIEKRAATLGIPDLKVSLQEVTSGIVVSDLLLSGHAGVGIGGAVPMFNLWNKTNGRVKGMMAISEGDMFLVTCDPHIKSIRDYTDNDRIAMTDLRTTTYAMMLQMKAAKEFGWDERNRFDRISVAMSDPDGMGAILSCKTDVKSQMTILPQSTAELASGKARVIFSSDEVLGHPYTFDAAFTTVEFKRDSPKVYEAVTGGLADAIKFIKENPEKAADMYMKDEPYFGPREMLIKLIKSETADHFSYTDTPNSTEAFTDFMYKSGTFKNQPKSWKDVWFENVWDLPGT
jgi:NitT/TauT family transport system substrate-binding protein